MLPPPLPAPPLELPLAPVASLMALVVLVELVLKAPLIPQAAAVV